MNTPNEIDLFAHCEVILELRIVDQKRYLVSCSWLIVLVSTHRTRYLLLRVSQSLSTLVKPRNSWLVVLVLTQYPFTTHYVEFDGDAIVTHYSITWLLIWFTTNALVDRFFFWQLNTNPILTSISPVWIATKSILIQLIIESGPGASPFLYSYIFELPLKLFFALILSLRFTLKIQNTSS